MRIHSSIGCVRDIDSSELTAMVCMPVNAVTVAEPPRMSIEETIMFVAKPKNMNTR